MDVLEIVCLLIKPFIVALYLVLFLKCRSFHQKTSSLAIKKLWLYICVFFAIEAALNSSSILFLVRKLIFPDSPVIYILWARRSLSILSCMEFFILGLFIEKLLGQQKKLSWRQYLSGIICTCLCLCWTYFLIFQFNTAIPLGNFYELLRRLSEWYWLLAFGSAYVYAIHKIFFQTPRSSIAYRQLQILFFGILTPMFCFVSFAAISRTIAPSIFTYGYMINRYINPYASLFNSLTDIYLMFSFYVFGFKLINLRFLNTMANVQATRINPRLEDLNAILARIYQMTRVEEAHHIVHLFFQKIFSIVPENITLYLRPFVYEDLKLMPQQMPVSLALIDHAVSDQQNYSSELSYLSDKRVLVFDELEFDHQFTDADQDVRWQWITFLRKSNIEVLIALYDGNDKSVPFGYITLHKGALAERLYTNTDQQKMLAFANSLAQKLSMIRSTQRIKQLQIMQAELEEKIIITEQEKTRCEKEIHQREKTLQDEVYFKHKEASCIRESMLTMLRTSSTRKLGVVLYRNETLVCGNAYAKEIFGVKTGEAIPQAFHNTLLKLLHDVKTYGVERAVTCTDSRKNQLTLYASPALPHNNSGTIAVIAFYPDVAETFAISFEKLKDPSMADYALYLQTTQSGQLLNTLIPNMSGALYHFKLELMKITLHKKPVLLHIPPEDMKSFAQLLHKISLRTTFEHIELTPVKPSNRPNVFHMLFGINTALSTAKSSNKTGLLATLSETGTIFIENIELLDRETQKALASFFTTGHFSPQYSSEKLCSNARIIFATTANIKMLVQEGSFEASLYEQLKEQMLTMPSLITLPHEELVDMMTHFGKSLLAPPAKQKADSLQLNEDDTKHVIENPPSSISELKSRTAGIIKKKFTPRGKQVPIIALDEKALVSPGATEAERAGVRALKDPLLLQQLWSTYHHQATIAKALGVERSSVCKRMKQFNIGQASDSKF